MALPPSDPRKVPGAIVGPGGPHDRSGVVVDTRRAVLLDTMEVSTVESDEGASAIAMLLGGRIVRSTDRANVLFLLGSDGAAAIITELIALYNRATGEGGQLVDDVMRRLRKLDREGNL